MPDRPLGGGRTGAALVQHNETAQRGPPLPRQRASMSQSTSPERTHRYLRLAIGGTVVVIFAAVLAAVPAFGWLSAISDYFYTPARNAFVGALIAASLALLALSGRGAERTLLDAAALFAPLIALVPTVIGSGSVPGVAVPCAPCVPPEVRADIANGVTTYAVVLAGVLVVALVLRRAGQSPGSGFSIALGAAVLAVVVLTGVLAPEMFLSAAHVIATVVFFALIAAVAVLNAFWRTTTSTPPRWLRLTYIAIAVVLVADTVFLLIATFARTDADGTAPPWILVGESLALLVFLAFWWLQTWQRWNEDDPASLRPTGGRLPPLGRR